MSNCFHPITRLAQRALVLGTAICVLISCNTARSEVEGYEKIFHVPCIEGGEAINGGSGTDTIGSYTAADRLGETSNDEQTRKLSTDTFSRESTAGQGGSESIGTDIAAATAGGNFSECRSSK